MADMNPAHTQMFRHMIHVCRNATASMTAGPGVTETREQQLSRRNPATALESQQVAELINGA